jgi:large subunit ribosomal protein L25
MERVELAAETRAVLGKQVKQLRRQGWVPGVMYGHRFDPAPVQFESRSLGKLLSHVGGSQLIAVHIQGQDQPEMALVRDVQRDPISREVLHVDLYRVDMAERLTAEVPLTIVGESPVVETREGILLQGISSVEVECLPGDLVDAIEVDVSELTEVEMGLYVRDLAASPGVDILTDPDEMIVRVVYVEEEEEEEIAEEVEEIFPGAEEVEVITEAAPEEAD